MKSTILFLTLLLLTFSLTGCAVIEAGNEMALFTWKAMKPRPTDYKSPFDDDGSEWDSVGKDGRGDRKKEYDPDPWYQKYIMSEKANSIERNVGIHSR